VRPIEHLLEIMAELRHPERGCPWDLEQNFATIAPYTIEEAYEVADAIARDDMAGLVDELGDLLFQVVFHARLAAERGAFDFDDVARAITDKLVRRHPHVFAGETVAGVDEQSRAWEAHKAAERAEKEAPGRESVLEGLARGRPPLARARELQKTAARHGFDWENAGEVLAKLAEEAEELEVALAAEDGAAHAAEELGDLLFTCVNLARHLQADPDAALRAANLKFERRFRELESRIAEQGRTLDEASMEEMESLWQQIKARGA